MTMPACCRRRVVRSCRWRRPVFTRASWESSLRGLLPRDLAMHVVLPEVDGRIFAHAIAFKERGESEAGFAPTVFRPVDDRIAATADLARAWVRLRRTSSSQRRVAIDPRQLSEPRRPPRQWRRPRYAAEPDRCARRHARRGLRHRKYARRCRVDDAASAGVARPTRSKSAAPVSGGVSWRVADYEAAFADLPENVQRAVEARWGGRGAGPSCRRTAAFVSVCIASATSWSACNRARGYNIDPKSSLSRS